MANRLCPKCSKMVRVKSKSKPLPQEAATADERRALSQFIQKKKSKRREKKRGGGDADKRSVV